MPGNRACIPAGAGALRGGVRSSSRGPRHPAPCARTTLLCGQFAASVPDHPGSRTGETGRGLLPGAGRGGVESLRALGRAFLQVLSRGRGAGSVIGALAGGASPNPEFRARLLLENAAFLAGGVHRPLPLPPGLRARLEVSERGRNGGSRPARALAKAGAPCGSPRAYPGDGVTGGRD